MTKELPVQQVNLLTQHYLQRVMPLEPITETIALQIQQIHQLEDKLEKLSSVNQELTEAELKILSKHKNTMARTREEEHREWVKESMIRLKGKFDGEFPKKSRELEEQIGLKSSTCNCSLDGTNVLSSLENSIESLEFVIAKAKKEDLVELKQHVKAYQNVLIKVENFEEAQEIDRMIKLFQERQK